ncbi:hypothetical protein Mapa_000531 [Marchantia paleacea]|nr:hypothetical protein Mapa_000531 [Marchantia paleacea]
MDLCHLNSYTFSLSEASMTSCLTAFSKEIGKMHKAIKQDCGCSPACNYCKIAESDLFDKMKKM